MTSAHACECVVMFRVSNSHRRQPLAVRAATLARTVMQCPVDHHPFWFEAELQPSSLAVCVLVF